MNRFVLNMTGFDLSMTWWFQIKTCLVQLAQQQFKENCIVDCFTVLCWLFHSWPSNNSKKILSRIYGVDGHPCAMKIRTFGPQPAHGGQPRAHGGQPTAHGGQPMAHGGQSTFLVGGTLWAFPPGPGRPSTRISNGHPILACAPCDKLYFTKAKMSTHVVKHKSSNILLYVFWLSLLASPSCN